jgi:hypothetical protein
VFDAKMQTNFDLAAYVMRSQHGSGTAQASGNAKEHVGRLLKLTFVEKTTTAQ